MKIESHYYKERQNGNSTWDAKVKHNGDVYEVFVERCKSATGSFYYTGGIKNTKIIKHSFADSWIRFGFSNYEEQYRYILKAMVRVIDGDYSTIRGVGHCVVTPNNISYFQY